MDLPLELLAIQEMASSFPDYANAILHLVGGSVVDCADGPVERVWTVSIGGRLFWLAHDEIGVSLDSKSRESTLLIPSIQETLFRHRSQSDA